MNETKNIDLQQIFNDLPADKKLEFLKELQEIAKLEDSQMDQVQRILDETIQEFEAENTSKA